MEPELERIAVKARSEPKRTFTSLAHPITLERRRENLSPMEKTRAAGVDGQTVAEVTENLDGLAPEVLRKIHNQGYHPPPVRCVGIPKPGKSEKRPIGIPTVLDRALQKSTAQVLEAIYEQDFLNGSLGGRPSKDTAGSFSSARTGEGDDLHLGAAVAQWAGLPRRSVATGEPRKPGALLWNRIRRQRAA